MNAIQVINPQKNSRSVDRQMLNAEKIFLLVAVFVTSVGFFVWGSSAAAQYIDNMYAQMAFGLAAALASAYVTDFAFRHFLEEVVFQALAAFHPNVTGRVGEHPYFKVLRIVRWAVLTIVVGLLFWADWNSVQTIKDPFAASAKQRETTDLASASANISASLGSASAPMAEQIKTLRADIADAERRTLSANASLVTLANQGNGWAKNQLEAKKKSATRATRKELDRLTATYTNTLAEQSAALTKTTNAINRENEQITLDNATKRQSLSAMFFMFGAGSKLLTVLLRILLVVSFLSKSPNLDANGDGTVDGKDVTAAAGF